MPWTRLGAAGRARATETGVVSGATASEKGLIVAGRIKFLEEVGQVRTVGAGPVPITVLPGMPESIPILALPKGPTTAIGVGAAGAPPCNMEIEDNIGGRIVADWVDVSGIVNAEPWCLMHYPSTEGVVTMAHELPIGSNMPDVRKSPSISTSVGVAARDRRGATRVD